MATYKWSGNAKPTSANTTYYLVDKEGGLVEIDPEAGSWIDMGGHKPEKFDERMKRLKKEKAEREQFEREMDEFCEWDQQED